MEQIVDQIWLRPEWLLDIGPEGVGVWLTPFYQAALGGAALAITYLLVRLFLPRVAAVAATTAKEALAQPLFKVLIAIGVFLLVVVFPFLPYNTFGEDVKVVKDSGLTVIMVLSFLLALWTASVSISDEIEGRTAVTVLSKPIGRRDFVLGKLFGIVIPVAINFLILGTVFLLIIGYKIGYDARDSVAEITDLQRMAEMTQVIPGLVLTFQEAVILSALSVAISTRLPMIANLTICGTVYALGHMMPVLVQSSNSQLELVQFMAKYISVILPNLDHFNMQAAVATGTTVPLALLGMTTLYAILYTAMMTVLALLLFEDRDLA